MQVTTIRFLKRIQESQFEPAELELTAQLGEGEHAEQAIVNLMAMTKRALSGNMTGTGLDSVPAKEKSSDLKTVQLSKEGEPNATAQMSQDSKYPDAKEEPARPATNKRAARGESKPVNKPDVAGVEPKEPKTTAPVDALKGSIVFDNTDKNLRIRLSNFLNTNYPKWKTIGDDLGDAEKKKAKILDTIKPLNGQAFEDSQANMLPTFAKQVETIFKAYK